MSGCHGVAKPIRHTLNCTAVVFDLGVRRGGCGTTVSKNIKGYSAQIIGEGLVFFSR